MKKKLMLTVLALACTCSFTACNAMKVDLNNVQSQIESAVASAASESAAASEATTESSATSEATTESSIASEATTESSTASEATTESSTSASEATTTTVELDNGVVVELPEGVTLVEESPEPTSSEGASSPSQAPAQTQTPSVAAPSELSDDIYSFQVSVNGTVYQFPMWYSDFIALGWTYDGDTTLALPADRYTGEMFIKDDVKAYVNIANLSINTQPYNECMVSGISFDDYYLDECDWEIVLPKGIQYGVSTKEDIIAAYGTPSSEYDGSMYYKLTYEYDTYSDVSLFVFKESGVLEEIEIDNLVELEGADNSVDSTVPDLVKNYSAPDSVGDDLYTFNVQLEGNMYTFPCPMSELLANGFTLKEAPDAIPSRSGKYVKLMYNNQDIGVSIINYADYATIPENCFVTDIEAGSASYSTKLDIVVPCDIKLGDSAESLVEKISKFNYKQTVNEADRQYYTVYHPDGSTLDQFGFLVEGGVITEIEVSNDARPEY